VKSTVVRDAIHFSSTLQGWCTPEKVEHLVESLLSLNEKADQYRIVIVEIGVFGGKSLAALTVAGEHIGARVYGIDPWTSPDALANVSEPANIEWWSGLDYEKIYFDVVEAFAPRQCTRILRMTSAQAAALIPRVDLIHIDGNHSEAQSLLDVTTWLPKMPAGGIIWLDDLDWYEAGQNTTAKARTFVEARCDLVGTYGTGTRYGCFRKR
jgi:hypothetical protein